MTIIRHTVKSCCGRKSFLLTTPKPIRKFQISIFEGAGYTAPSNFLNHGVFYVRNSNLTATAPYGSTTIKIQCFGDNCAKTVDDFILILEKAINHE